MENEIKATSNNSAGPSVKLAAEIGTEMQVEITDSGSRSKLIMVGIVPDQYLLFQIPEKNISSKTLKIFEENSIINIRCISRGIAFGFNSIIMGATIRPDTLLFVKYPEFIQQQSIRKNQRVKCLLPATLNQDAISIQGTIADLSSSGCHFQTQKSLLDNEQISILQPDTFIKIAILLPAVEVTKDIPAQIKNTFSDLEKVQLGIEFTKVDQNTNKLIENFVNMSFEIPPF
ncbi:MAG: flagellar brake protein [Gammaproteobacteria bacterium]|nr:flagellar brake protein [Gammaproteobacteria bacterium]